jgi:hypothetical protein
VHYYNTKEYNSTMVLSIAWLFSCILAISARRATAENGSVKMDDTDKESSFLIGTGIHDMYVSQDLSSL